MATQNLPPNDPEDNTDRLVKMLRALGITTAEQFRALLAQAETWQTEREVKPEPEPQPEPQPPMGTIEALTIAKQACEFLLSDEAYVSSPGLAAFDLDHVTAARVTLHELGFNRFDGTRQADPLKKAFVALGQIQGFLGGYGRLYGQKKPSIKKALDGVTAMLADYQGTGGEYWRGFAREALAEVRAIWEG